VTVLIFLMVERTTLFHVGFTMGQQNKLTKQGVRDLNHLTPKVRPVAIAPESVLAAEAPTVSPAAVVPQGAVTFSLEK
jgi:hypothetical protein